MGVKVSGLPALSLRGFQHLQDLALGRRRPFSITCILTNRCNFRCSYCNIPAEDSSELSTQAWCDALSELRAVGLVRASFSGGEAMLRDDAPFIIAHAKALGLSTSLNSNGWLTDAHIEELAKSLDVLMISLDGPQAVHDRQRDRPGSFDRALATLDHAKQLGVATTSITVLTAHNLDVVMPMLELAKAHRFTAYFQPAHQDCFGRDRGLDPAFDPGVARQIAAQLRQAAAQGWPVGASAGFLQRLENAPQFHDCSRCLAGRFFATILPDGTLIPCHLTRRDHPWPGGAKIGFARAFQELQRPSPGSGCAISPYQETDLILRADPSAIGSALKQLLH